MKISGAGLDLVSSDDSAFYDIFSFLLLGHESEPISDFLITELSARGVPRLDLIWLRDAGYRYSRRRDSFFISDADI